MNEEENAELEAYREFPHVDAGQDRQLAKKEKLGTIEDNESQALEIRRKAIAEKRGLTSEESDQYWGLLEKSQTGQE